MSAIMGHRLERTDEREAETARIEAFVSSMTSRSTPRPRPPVGGIPSSRARRKSSSTSIASGSPAAARTDCSTSRARWSTGSVSSV